VIEGKVYLCDLYQPHILALAINEAHPEYANRFAVNLGCGDGRSMNDPVFPLYEAGFGGLCIDGADQPDLATNLPSPGVVKLTGTMITPANAVKLLRRAVCPATCDFLKLDIDSYDGPVLETILAEGYRPKVLQIEINGEIPPPIAFAVYYDPRFRITDDFGSPGGYFGVSLSYAAALGAAYGYSVCYLDFVTNFTHDVTLVQNDYLPVAMDVFGPRFVDRPLRDLWLEQPPQYSHFAEFGIDSLAWRAVTDFDDLLRQVWDGCMQANIRKHGGMGTPFQIGLA
jgi:hypothetical protein